jgi:hypothetical protein
MTPDQFLTRVLAAVDDAAFRLSHTHDQEEWLDGFADRVRAQWRDVFSPVMSTSDVDGMVSDLTARFRAKRDSLESHGMGTA